MTEGYITWIIHKITDLSIIGIGVSGIAAVMAKLLYHL